MAKGAELLSIAQIKASLKSLLADSAWLQMAFHLFYSRKWGWALKFTQNKAQEKVERKSLPHF